MRLKKRIRKNITEAYARVYSHMPTTEMSDPVFILGCGRSGTTILGTVLAKHKKITYLNEPRQLWSMVYPETDVWGSSQASLQLTANDASEIKNKRIRRFFYFETIRTGSPVLIEKLPVNSFRLGFIDRIFPSARYIHIIRNGLEVASSIDNLCKQGKWFHSNPYRWQQLLEYARQNDDAAGLHHLCVSDYEKALFEWRLSVAAIKRFLKSRPLESYKEITYDELVSDPVTTVTNILSFLGLEENPDVTDYAQNKISRRSWKLGEHDLTDNERLIGGQLLLESF
jgi:hypothetical protein